MVWLLCKICNKCILLSRKSKLSRKLCKEKRMKCGNKLARAVVYMTFLNIWILSPMEYMPNHAAKHWFRRRRTFGMKWFQTVLPRYSSSTLTSLRFWVETMLPSAKKCSTIPSGFRWKRIPRSWVWSNMKTVILVVTVARLAKCATTSPTI